MIEDVARPELMKDFNQYLAERYSAEYKNVEKGFVTNTEYLDGLAKEDDLLTGTAEVPEITGGTGD